MYQSGELTTESCCFWRAYRVMSFPKTLDTRSQGLYRKTYYQAITGTGLGKLSPKGDKWEDSRTKQEVTIEKLERAINRLKE